MKMPVRISAHKLLSAIHLDTLADDVVAGDMIYGNATPIWARLAKGTDGKYLAMVAGYPVWTDPPGGAAHNLLSATHSDTLADSVVAGDILIGNATSKWARLAKGIDGYVLTLSSGLPAWAPPGAAGAAPACRIRHSADQNLTTGVWLASLFDTEDFDNDNMHSTVANIDRITINTAGIYLVGGHACIESNATNSFRWLQIYKNGAVELLQVNEWSQGAALHTWMHTDGILQLAAGDYLQFRAVQTSGSTLKLYSVTDRTPMFYAVRLSA
jgi:hypothetical protein